MLTKSHRAPSGGNGSLLSKLETTARALSPGCEQVVEESWPATEKRLAALEARLKSTLGQLPIVKACRAESVTYGSSCRPQWRGVSSGQRYGKDAGRLRGLALRRACRSRCGYAGNPRTFDVREAYKQLDVVVSGGVFIAKRDDPGTCPGA